MIGAFFAILKAIGLLLLIIFTVLLILIILVLFWPIKYRVTVKYIGKKLEYEIRISWLAKLISFYALNTNDCKKTRFRVAWLKIISYEKSNEEIADEKVINTIDKAKEKQEENQPQLKSKNSEILHKSESTNDSSKTAKSEAKEEERSDNKINRIKNLLKQAKETHDNPDKDEIIKAVIALLKQLLKAIKPKAMHLNCEFGFETPDTTGMVLGVAVIIKTIINKKKYHIDIKGNFTEQLFNIDTDLNGKIALWDGLWPFLAFAFKKPIWKIISAKLFNKKQ